MRPYAVYGFGTGNAASVGQLTPSNSGRSGSIHYNTAIFLFLSSYFQGIDDSGENDDGCTVLVIMKYRDIENFF